MLWVLIRGLTINHHFLNPKFSSLVHPGGLEVAFLKVILAAVVQHFRFDKVKKKVGNLISIGNSLSAFLTGRNMFGRQLVSSFQLSA